jgi:hypothetical protein
MRLHLVLLAGLLAAAVAAGVAPASAAPGATGCRVFADIPDSGPGVGAQARMFAWAEVHCASRTTLTVRVCAQSYGPGPLAPVSGPMWCRSSQVLVPAGGKAFARTRVHPCTAGRRYFSSASLDGLTIDRGPWAACRLDP